MSLPRVRAVVLNWNGGEFVLRCIEHLTRTDWPPDRFEIVVLDNASTDGSDRALAARFCGTGSEGVGSGSDESPGWGPDRCSVTVRPTGANLGFVANNLALRDLDGIDYVALVNNDAFVDPGWLRPLVEELEGDTGLGAACPRMLFAPAFHELRIESPTFVPPGDGRALGVRVREVATQGRSVFALCQFISGAWGIEPDSDGAPFRWLSGDATIRVAIADEAEAGSFGFVDIELAAESEKQVVLSCGLYKVTVTVCPEWRRYRIPHWQRPFDVVNNAGGVVLADGFGADRGYLQVDDGRFDQPADVFNWCGGGALLRRQYLEHAGLFDERFFLYYEDTDLSWRGRALGWRYHYVPGSVIRHLHAASSGEGSSTFQFFVERNRLMMLTKNAPADLACRAVIGSVTATISYALRDVLPPLRRLHRPPVRHVLNRVLAFRSYLKHLPSMIVARRELEARRTVSHEILAASLTARRDWSDDERLVSSLAGWSIAAEPFPRVHDPHVGSAHGDGRRRRRELSQRSTTVRSGAEHEGAR